MIEMYQIYYKDEQKENLYPFAIPYKNETFSPYFENECIRKIVPTTKEDTKYVSVCSWRLRQKRGDSSTEMILKRAGIFELTKERLEQTEYDIAILTPRSPSHRPLVMASNWHGKAWDNAFMALKIFLHGHNICKVPDELTNTIYENHFSCKREIYCDYVSQCLEPVLSYIEKEKGVFEADANYIQKLRNDPQKIKEYQQASGRTDYSISPFLLERLFSIWIEGKNLKIINL